MSRADARPTIGVADYRNASERKRRLYDRVRTWADLRLLDPERDHPDLPEMGFDCFHMARWTPHALRDLQRAEDGGIPTVNSYEGAATTVDRLAKCRRIERAGLRVPPYEFGPAEEIALDPPVVVKSRDEFVSGGHDLFVIFAGEIDFAGERFVQRYIAPKMSFKLFQVGEQVRSTRHPPSSGVVEWWSRTSGPVRDQSEHDEFESVCLRVQPNRSNPGRETGGDGQVPMDVL